MESEKDKQLDPVDPDDLEEINSENDSDENEDEGVQVSRGIKDDMARVLGEIDPDEIEEFDWCHFNREAMESIVSRITKSVPRFMKIAGIETPDELSTSNPPFVKVIKLGRKTITWYKFIDVLIRDGFPTFSFQKFGVNRIEMATIIIDRLIKPILKKENVNFKMLEEEFNEKLLYRLVQKRSAEEE